MAIFKLTYFNARGIAESIRMILIYSGQEFQDIRVSYDEWISHLKKETPFGKLPLLEVDGKLYHQSMAICRHLGKEKDLAGLNNWENLQMDLTAETFADFKQNITDYFFETDEQDKVKKLQRLINDTVPFYLGRFDSTIKENGGYFAAGRISWVDFYFIGYSETMEAILKQNVCENYPHISQLRKKLYSIPKIRDWISKRPDSVY